MSQIINKPTKESKKNFSSATSARSATTPNAFSTNLRLLAIIEANERAIVDSIAEPKDYATEYQASLLREITSLPELHQKILWLMFDDFKCDIDFWDRSLAELARRFKRHPKTISKALCELESWGFVKCKGKRRLFKNRWITCAGRRKLDIQRKLKTRSLNSPLPYIDLLSLKEDKRLIMIDEQICGQLQPIDENFPEFALEDALNSFIVSNNGTESISSSVIQWFKRATVTVKEKIRILNRAIAANAKKPIQSFVAYFKSCLRNADILRKIHITLVAAHLKSPQLVPLYKYDKLQYSNYANLEEKT